MKKLTAIIFTLLLYGCTVKNPMLLEGSSLKLGAYIPWDGNLYGLEIMSFTTGTLFISPSNEVFNINHQSSQTNCWLWGMLESVESNTTKIKWR